MKPAKTIKATKDLSLLIVDDEEAWVEVLVRRFREKAIRADGLSDAAELLRWGKEKFVKYDMIFLDMHLGDDGHGRPMFATDVLLHLLTYSPASRVVTFTQRDANVIDCIRCIQLGARGLIPKTGDIDHYLLVASVYSNIGDEEETREERIATLWSKLTDEVGTSNNAKGRFLEMLVVNVLDSIPGFRTVGSNEPTPTGELDIIVENLGTHAFWKQLDSFHIVVECKNELEKSGPPYFHSLAGRVAAKDSCRIGIMVAWSGVTSGFQSLQRGMGGERPHKLFALDSTHVEQLVRRNSVDREKYLRDELSRQL